MKIEDHDGGVQIPGFQLVPSTKEITIESPDASFSDIEEIEEPPIAKITRPPPPRKDTEPDESEDSSEEKEIEFGKMPRHLMGYKLRTPLYQKLKFETHSKLLEIKEV